VEPGHRQLDHTADLAIELWGPNEEALLLEGARAIVELLTAGAPLRATAERAVTVSALDREDRLVQWLNEMLYAAVTDGFLFVTAELALLGPDLHATVRGEQDGGGKLVTELKSVTYHDLLLESDAKGWRARIVIDV
jgi:SHS2 domain-containing protein